MTRYIARGNGIQVPLDATTVDEAIIEVENGGRKFCAWQTFDICLYDEEFGMAGEEVAVMVDIHDPSWLEEWGDPEDLEEDFRP